jgi:hypothetical protein
LNSRKKKFSKKGNRPVVEKDWLQPIIADDKLEEWDSDSDFDFDEEDWPCRTPKFARTMYNGEVFPFCIEQEGKRVIYGQYFVHDKTKDGYLLEKQKLLVKKKDVRGFLVLENVTIVGSASRKTEVFTFKQLHVQ